MDTACIWSAMFYPATAIPEIEKMLALPKTMNEWPVWETHGSARDGEWRFLTTLAHDGLGIAGVRLRGSALQSHLDREVTLQLEAFIGRKLHHLVRADYRPLHSHRNPFSRKDLPLQIMASVTHIHGFRDNVRNGQLDDLDSKRNLPAARVIDPSPSSVRVFFATVGTELGIPDLSSIEPPPWQGGFPV